MTGRPQRPRLPELESHEARARAEDHLGHGEIDRSTAYALLAVAGELATIRRELQHARR